MKKTKRILTLFLVFCMTAGMLLACNNADVPLDTTPQAGTTTTGDPQTPTDPSGGTTPPVDGDQNQTDPSGGTTPPVDDDQNQTDPSGGTTPPVKSEQEKYLPETLDLGNYEFRMYLGLRESDESSQYFFSTAGLSGDAISQALYERNVYIEETFNCIITPIATLRNAPNERDSYMIQPYLDANEDLWDVILIPAGEVMQQNVLRGDVIDVLQLENLNLEASYWDQAIQKDYSINGRVFALQGDYTIQDELSTSGVFYNRNLWDKWGYYGTYGEPYRLVKANEWTYDLMLEMLKDTSKKANGKTFTENDVFGAFASCSSIHTLLLGSGLKTLTVEDGESVITIRDNAAFTNMFDVLNDIVKKTYVENEEILISGTPRADSIMKTKNSVVEMFMADQALFLFETVDAAATLRCMDSSFGILPIPQYYEDQTEYYCWCTTDNMPMTVPKTVVTHDHVEEVSTLMEAIAYFSRYTVDYRFPLYEAFYEKMTVLKLCRTADDYRMIDLIYKSKCYDLDSAASLSRIYQLSLCMQEERTLYYGPGATDSSGIYTLKPTYSTFRSNMESVRQKFNESVDAYLYGVERNLVILE